MKKTPNKGSTLFIEAQYLHGATVKACGRGYLVQYRDLMQNLQDRLNTDIVQVVYYVKPKENPGNGIYAFLERELGFELVFNNTYRQLTTDMVARIINILRPDEAVDVLVLAGDESLSVLSDYDQQGSITLVQVAGQENKSLVQKHKCIPLDASVFTKKKD